MKYSKDEVLQYIEEEDVKFIRLAFCDVFGNQKNISIMPSEIRRAFKDGIVFDASSISGFGDEMCSDLLLHPDPSTLTVLPWRPEHGRVVRMFCDITRPDGKPFEYDSRSILKNAIDEAKKVGAEFMFGSELEFYLFKLDENGIKTDIPYDNAGYMDIAPDDKGENVRREICLSIEQMGIIPESSHHEAGPGQNEIDFKYSDTLEAADNAVAFKSAVKTISYKNGLFADFSAKPIADMPGNGFHINLSIKDDPAHEKLNKALGGVMKYIRDITVFLNTTEGSYKRLGKCKAPKYISWSKENRSQLIRIPAAFGDYKRAELRSPDPMANPYLAFAMIIYASIDGIKNNLEMPQPTDVNLYSVNNANIPTLPTSLVEAKKLSIESEFVNRHLPKEIIDIYCK